MVQSESPADRVPATYEGAARELLNQARSAISSGDNYRALEAAGKVVELLSAWPDDASFHRSGGAAYLAAADTFYEVGDIDRAEASYRRAMQMCDPGSAGRYEALLGLGLSLDHLGRSDESRLLYQEIIADPGARELDRLVARRNMIYAEGVNYFARGEFEAARASFNKALTLHTREDDDFRSDILLWVGACSAQLGQFAAAHEVYAEVVASTGAHDSVKAQASQWCAFAEGQLHFAARRYQDARAKFEEILARRGVANEFRSGVALMAAHCCLQLREYTQASRRYRSVLKAGSASQAQKREARQARRALPGVIERWYRTFARRLGWNV